MTSFDTKSMNKEKTILNKSFGYKIIERLHSEMRVNHKECQEEIEQQITIFYRFKKPSFSLLKLI